MKFGTWNSRMDFPKLDSVIFLDIETDLETKKIWLVGTKHEQEEKQFIAKNFSQETYILQKFANYLASKPNLPLVCYSTTNFDFRVLWKAANRLGINDLQVAMRERPLVDLGTLLRRHFTPYGKSYSLKMIRYLVGYRYKNEDIFGDDIAIQYYREVEKLGQISDDFEKLAKSYNLDDVRVMYHIVSKFSEHINFTNMYTNDLNLPEISKNLQDLIYTYCIKGNYIRISCKHEHARTIRTFLMSLGCPLPEERVGVNITAFYWKSNFSYNRALEACNLIGLSDTSDYF